MMKLYTGCVEDRNDPLKLGRCKVRIVGLHTESTVSLPTDDLPWAYPLTPITSAGISGIGSTPLGPVPGTWVMVTFMDADQQMPIMLGSMHGAHQTAESLMTGVFQVDTVDPAGNVDLTGASPQPLPDQGEGGSSGPVSVYGGSPVEQDGKIVTNNSEIVGPLAKLVAKAESGQAGYNAYNKGTRNGKIIPSDKAISLTEMKIKDIMSRQSLKAGDPERLFAVGKYQTIPSTLKEACSVLNIDINEPFSELTQDIICQEYLVAKKRPPLIAYYRNPDKNNEKLQMDAGRALAAEFASIEDPYHPGFPYGGERGSYFKSGNKVGTTWETIQQHLLMEWDFRNGSKPPTAGIAKNDKNERGADFLGVMALMPEDDSETSEATPPSESNSSSSGGGGGDLPDTGDDLDLGGIVDGIIQDAVEDLDINLDGLELPDFASALDLVGLQEQLIGAVFAAINSIDITAKITDILGGLTSGAQELLNQFGGSVSEIATNLGIPNVSGSVSELVDRLGIVNPTPELLAEELLKMAGSRQGQARAMLMQLNKAQEPSMPEVSPVGITESDGSTSNGTGIDPTIGFQDPSGTYPRYRNESDTNRLATGNNLGRTIVLEKEANAKTGIRIANGGTWDQSPSPYNAKYPYNKVMQTESGHVQEWDDTPGSERINTYHKSGTYTEIDANGTTVNRIVGDGFEIMERNGFVYVNGAYCVSVEGAMNLRTDNIFNLEVAGAANIKIYNNANIDISGDCNLAVGASLNAKAFKVNLESEGPFNIKAGTGLNIEAGADINLKGGAAFNTQTEGDINVKSVGGLFTETEGDIQQKAIGVFNAESVAGVNLKTDGNMNLNGEGEVSVLSGGDVYIDGAIVDLNNGLASEAESPEEPKEARGADAAELVLPVETRGTSGIDRFPPMSLASRGSEFGFDEPNVGELTEYRNYRVASNESFQTETSDLKYEKDRVTPNVSPASAPTLPAGYQQILSMPTEQFTAGMKISKYFTLGDMTKGGTRIPTYNYSVKGEAYTPQLLVANLCNLAHNALDPIREKFGEFTITSGLRRPPHGDFAGDLGRGRVEGGDHPRGCAVDIVFAGGKQENYRICQEIVKLIPSWNQVIMEYSGNSVWIHISVKPASNSGHMFTMVNHKTYQGTYPKGGFVLV